MKLNNRGWGLGAMIGFLCVFAIFIIVIAFLAYNLGIGGKEIVPLLENSSIGYFINL